MSKLLSELDNRLASFLIDTEELPDDFSAFIYLDGSSTYGTIEIMNDRFRFTSDDIVADIFIHISYDMEKYLVVQYSENENEYSLTVHDNDTSFLLAFNYQDNLYVTAGASYLLNICKIITGEFINFVMDINVAD